MQSREDQLRSLLLASRSGDQAATSRFLTLLAGHLRGYFRRHAGRTYTGGATDPEDLVQETLLAVHLKRHTYDESIPITAWIHAIARYKLIDAVRAAGRRPQGVDVDSYAEILAAEETSPAAEGSLDLNRLLDTLPERTRALVVDTKLTGLSMAEAAARAGMSETAVKVAVHRALRSLAKAFGARAG